MYSLDNDVTNPAYRSTGGHAGLFADNVNYKRIQVGEGSELRIKILPAHDPTVAKMEGERIAVDPISWVPFRSPDGNLNTWGRKIYLVQFVGHGSKGKGTRRRDFISLKSYSGGGETFCPIVALQDAIRREPMWQYLIKDKMGDDGKTVVEGKTIGRDLSIALLANIIDINDVGKGVQLAVFTKSAYDKLLDRDSGGIAWQANMNATPEQIAENPMLRWACGDLTDPTNGPVLTVKKDTASDNRRFAGYTIDYCVTTQGVLRYPVDQSILGGRYNLLDLHTVIPKPTEEDLIQGLVQQLDGFAPTGEHEYELLKHVFGSMSKIPDPPAKTFSPGMGAQPGAVPPPAAAPPAAGTGEFVQPKIGQAAAPAAAVPPPGQQAAAVPPPGQQTATVPPPGQQAAAAPPPAAQPPVPQPTPATAPPTTAAPLTEAAMHQEKAIAAGAAVPPTIPANAAPAPTVPGDAAPAFDRSAFLGQLKDQANG